MSILEAPELIGMSIQGENIDVLEMSKEKPVIVYFWATWCIPCKFVSPTISWMSNSEDYDIVGVSIGSGSDTRVKRFMDVNGYDFININDAKGFWGREWGISVTPTVVFIKDGEIKTVTTGITTPPGLLARAWLTSN